MNLFLELIILPKNVQRQFPSGNGRLQLHMGLLHHFWVCFIRDVA